jgi:LPS export ABC transporter protein LptC
MRDFVIDAFSDGKRDWTLSSPEAQLFEQDESILVSTPTVKFYEEEQLSSGFTSGRARLNTRSKDMRAWDGVVMTSTDGATLTSEWFDYIHEKDLIVSTAPVTVEKGGTLIRGIGWTATPDLSKLSVERQTVEISGEELPQPGGKER